MITLFPSSRRLWRRVGIGIAVSFLLLAANLPPWGLRRDRDSFQCMTCLSRRDLFQWKIGPWSSQALPVSSQRSIITESKTLRFFAPQPHIHQWQFAQGSPYYWFGKAWCGCALGEGRYRNDLAMMVEGSWAGTGWLGADRFLEDKLNSGDLSTNQLYQALISPKFWKEDKALPTPDQKLAQQLADEGFMLRP